MLGAGIAVAIAYFLLLASPLRNRHVYWFSALLVTVALNRNLVYIWPRPPREGITGISAGAPTLSSSTVVILSLLTLGLALRFKRGGWVWIVPAVVGLTLGVLTVWPRTENVAAGAFYLTVCLLAWVVGNWFGRYAADSPETVRGLSVAICVFMALQLGFCALQAITGEGIRTSYGERAVGTFDHPGTLGKVVLLLLMLTLPMTQVKDRITSRAAIWATGLGVVATTATASRSNTIVLFGVLALWVLFTRARAWGVRTVAVAAVAVVATMYFAEKILERFREEGFRQAESGPRAELLDAWLRTIPGYVWSGMGPNNYVETVRTTEPVVAVAGYPIHNSILLAVAEMGIILAVLFFLPVIRTVILAITSVKGNSIDRGNVARAVLIVLFAILIASGVSWGFLREPIATLLFFVLGYAHGQLAQLGVHRTTEPAQSISEIVPAAARPRT